MSLYLPHVVTVKLSRFNLFLTYWTIKGSLHEVPWTYRFPPRLSEEITNLLE